MRSQFLTVEPEPQARFLFDLAPRCMVGQLVTLDVAAGWEPQVLLGMAVEQYLSGVHDKGSCCKVSGNFSHSASHRHCTWGGPQFRRI
jgi:hypothetical protein